MNNMNVQHSERCTILDILFLYIPCSFLLNLFSSFDHHHHKQLISCYIILHICKCDFLSAFHTCNSLDILWFKWVFTLATAYCLYMIFDFQTKPLINHIYYKLNYHVACCFTITIFATLFFFLLFYFIFLCLYSLSFTIIIISFIIRFLFDLTDLLFLWFFLLIVISFYFDLFLYEFISQLHDTHTIWFQVPM